MPDPGNPQAFDRYTYVYNNPISNTDPTGNATGRPRPCSAQSSLAGTAMAAVAWIGAACSMAGYLTKNPLLATMGSVMLGFAGGFVGGSCGLPTRAERWDAERRRGVLDARR